MAIAAQRKIPFVGTVDTNPETKPFFDGCAAGKLVLPQCVATKKFIWYPRAHLAVHAWARWSGRKYPARARFTRTA